MLGAAAVALLLLSGCDGQPKNDAGDRFAGLDSAIRVWKDDIAAHHPSCQAQAAGQRCQFFEVACKAERVITPEEQAQGVTAKVVANMSWSGFDSKGAEQPASAAAEFSRAEGVWRRREAKPVNPATCADL